MRDPNVYFAELADVLEFQRHFRIPMSEVPALILPEHMDFRIKFLQEELDELKLAVSDGDLIKAADALVDLEYVLKGTVLMMGLGTHWPRLWDAVHTANMRKVRAESADQSKRGSSLDVIKPSGWEPPDLQRILLS